MGSSILLFHKETTPLNKLPSSIYYCTRYKFDKLIDGFKAVKINQVGERIQKSFSINKYTLPIAYKKAIEYVYGEDKVEEVLLEFPVPNIHPDDLYVNNKGSPVYGVNLVTHKFSSKTNYLLSGFIVIGKDSVHKYFSISKLGLEDAWKRAIEYRYSIYKPTPNDNTELPKEYWDLINPKYRIKGA